MSSQPGLPNEDGRKFWCHQCRAEIRPSSDFSCLGCGNDFIEEMEETPEDDPTNFVVYGQPGSTPPPTVATPQQPPLPLPPQPQYLFQTMFGNPGVAPPFPPYQPPQAQPLPLDFGQMFQQVDAMLQQMATPQQQQQQQHAVPPVMQVFTTGGGAGMPPMNFQTFMQSMLSGINGGPMVGNPGDYAFGNLDNIITRLMETAGDRGPPPAAEDAVESLPSVRISQEAVDAHEDCAICKDEYALGEEALKLACEHRFHPICIKEWLGRRNTCPVCRFQLKATEKQDKGNNGHNHGGGNNGRGPGGGGRGGGSNENNSADSPFQFYM